WAVARTRTDHHRQPAAGCPEQRARLAGTWPCRPERLAESLRVPGPAGCLGAALLLAPRAARAVRGNSGRARTPLRLSGTHRVASADERPARRLRRSRARRLPCRALPAC